MPDFVFVWAVSVFNEAVWPIGVWYKLEWKFYIPSYHKMYWTSFRMDSILRNGLKNKKSQNSTTNAQLNEQVSEWIQSWEMV